MYLVNTRDINSTTGTPSGCTSSGVSLDVPLVEFLYLAFTRRPGESYRRVPVVEFLCLVL